MAGAGGNKAPLLHTHIYILLDTDLKPAKFSSERGIHVPHQHAKMPWCDAVLCVDIRHSTARQLQQATLRLQAALLQDTQPSSLQRLLLLLLLLLLLVLSTRLRFDSC
jgi:hypothetical protein